MRQNQKDAVRLNKLMAESGFCSRREADLYIEQERVVVNGHIAKMGQKVFKTDFIRIDGELLRIAVVEQEEPVEEFVEPRRPAKLVDRKKKELKKEPETAKKAKPAAEKKPVKKFADDESKKKVGAAKKWFSGRRGRTR